MNGADTCRTGGTAKCLRGHCQGDRDSDVFGSAAVNNLGERVYCYVSTPSHSPSSEQAACDTSDPSCCTTARCCPADFSCSLPGPLHGHTTTKLQLNGKTPVMLMFGGERTDIDAPVAQLSGCLRCTADSHHRRLREAACQRRVRVGVFIQCGRTRDIDVPRPSARRVDRHDRQQGRVQRQAYRLRWCYGNRRFFRVAGNALSATLS